MINTAACNQWSSFPWISQVRDFFFIKKLGWVILTFCGFSFLRSVSCSICYGINAWSWVDKCLVPWRTHVESWNSALSARPNDGIHLLFYGHSWSRVAPIWPKAHILSLLFHFFLPYSFHRPSWFFFALPYFTFFISNCSATFSQCLLFSIFILYSLSFQSSWLIALMFFLWSTATSS